MTEEHLAGVRVLDFSIWRPGPYATRLLADLGADVLKVEPPGGDPMRAFPELFATVAAHKRSIVLDLHDASDRRRALELAAVTDVVVEGYRPGVAARLGIGHEHVRGVNPSVVYCSLSGYGQSGIWADVPGHDVNYQAVAGTLTPTGGAPERSPAIPWGDLASGLTAAFAVCAALVGRQRTGEGEHVDVAMVDILATWTGAVTGATLIGAGAPIGALASYGTFATADDGHVALGVTTEQPFWESLCDALGLADLRALDLTARLEREAELRARLEVACAAYTRDRLVDLLLSHGVPASPVHTREEMLASEALRARGTVTTGPGGEPALGHPVRFDRRRARLPAGAPELDEHAGQGFGPRSQGTIR